jgi:hypothetical protein
MRETYLMFPHAYRWSEPLKTSHTYPEGEGYNYHHGEDGTFFFIRPVSTIDQVSPHLIGNVSPDAKTQKALGTSVYHQHPNNKVTVTAKEKRESGQVHSLEQRNVRNYLLLNECPYSRKSITQMSVFSLSREEIHPIKYTF